MGAAFDEMKEKVQRIKKFGFFALTTGVEARNFRARLVENTLKELEKRDASNNPSRNK